MWLSRWRSRRRCATRTGDGLTRCSELVEQRVSHCEAIKSEWQIPATYTPCE